MCVTWLPVSSKAVTVLPFTMIFSSLALPISLGQGSGFKTLEKLFLSVEFLAIPLPPILVELEMVGECLGEVGLLKHSLPVTAPCLLARDNSS